MDRRANFLLGLAGVMLFCLPLFINLGGLDLRSDEAIHAYAVARILETDEWLTPRSIGVDGPFLEKPPLKFWLSAALIRAGVVAFDERGLRLLDALFGAMGFIYIYALALRFAGPIAGLIAVFFVYLSEQLIYEHGLRSYNMEAPLFLCYCGGMYHFVRWVEGARRARSHAFAVAGWFVLGFATKFVAALFLPMVLAMTTLVAATPRQRVAAAWREWLAPAALTVALIAPWFVYQSYEHGELFWTSILGEHVYRRFTSALDPAHLKPWHYYITETWDEFSDIHGEAMFVVGVLVLFAHALRSHPWQMRLLLIWFALPLVLISAGTSKLFHYFYPFLPPIGLAVGWFVQMLCDRGLTFVRPVRAVYERITTRVVGARPQWSSLRGALVAVAIGAVALAGMTALSERVVWSIGGVRVFQNSSVFRPLVIAVVCLAFAGRATIATRLLLLLLIAAILPLARYPHQVARANEMDTRLRTIQGCIRDIREAGVAPLGIYNAARFPHWSFYYYLRDVGPWLEPENPTAEDLKRRLAGDQLMPVLLMPENFRALQTPTAAAVLDGLVIAFPGPYAPCAARALAAGASPIDSVSR